RLPKALSRLKSHSPTARSVAKICRARLRMRATRKTFSETSTGSGDPLPCFRVSVLRATPSFSASTELERPRVPATCSNMLAGKPRRTSARISFAGRSASEKADCICAKPTPNGLTNWAKMEVYLDSAILWQALKSNRRPPEALRRVARRRHGRKSAARAPLGSVCPVSGTAKRLQQFDAVEVWHDDIGHGQGGRSS